MIKYALPGLYENYSTTIAFLHLISKEPEVLQENTSIGAIYGNFQFCTWDGGRIFSQYRHSSVEEIQYLTNIYNKDFNIPMRLVFTNNLLKETDCFDRYNNLILTICDNPLNEIVINSPILEDYIRKNYPNYKIISSTTKCLNNQNEAIQELNEKYHLVCLDYNLNKSIKFLESLSSDQKDKVEILINAVCGPGCPNRKEHYRLNSLFSNNYGKRYNMRYCKIDKDNLHPINYPTVLSPQEVQEIYQNFNISNFKIEGRTFNSIEYLCNIVKYLIKPEYQLYVIKKVSSIQHNYLFGQK